MKRNLPEHFVKQPQAACSFFRIKHKASRCRHEGEMDLYRGDSRLKAFICQWAHLATSTLVPNMLGAVVVPNVP